MAKENDKSKQVQMLEDLIPAVFKAEDELSKIWQPRLAEGKFKGPEERAKIADAYVHALAVHIVGEEDE